MAICKLCLKEKALIKKSHIIPDFMYRGMFDENHKLLSYLFRRGKIEKSEVKRPSDGEYESDIMCDECDNKLLGHYLEDYASRAIYGGKLSKNECPTFQKCISQNGIGFIKCRRLNYTKFKLFLLSILWRASISKRPFFAEINLEVEHEEALRKMILAKNAGEVWEYPIFVCSYVNNYRLPKQLIAQPRHLSTTNDIQLYSFMINGYFYFFYVNKSKDELPHFVTTETINPSNELSIIFIPEECAPDLYLPSLE